MKTLVFLVATLMVTAAGLAQAEGLRQITVSGSGTVETPPNMALITLGVTTEDKEAVPALRETSGAVTRILNRLTELGIDARDVQTRDLSLSPVWSNKYGASGEDAKITGFVSSNRVIVKVRDLSKLGLILDQVITDGANDFNGLQFSVEDPKPLEDLARAKAVADATENAQQLASAAGVKLGAVISISENGGGGRPMMRMAAMAEGGSVPIAGGEVSVETSVSMVFAIQD